MHHPVFFIHIPKTAGTSFRKAAEQYYDPDKVIRDYGIHAAETSVTLKQQNPDIPDFWSTRQQILATNPALIIGHVNAMRYAPVIPTRNITTLVREPFSQALSHFNHYRREHGYTRSFSDFLGEPRFTNIQSRYMQGVPIQAYALLGLTEQFPAYIQQYNALYGTELGVTMVNTTAKPELTMTSVEDQDRQDFLAKNQADIKLYEAVSELVEQRTAFAHAPGKWTHGNIAQIKDEVVSGWAWHAGPDEPVMVECLLDNEVIDCKPAIDFRAHLRALKVPRDSYVGFSFKLTHMNPGCVITCRTRDTGQTFAREIQQ